MADIKSTIKSGAEGAVTSYVISEVVDRTHALDKANTKVKELESEATATKSDYVKVRDKVEVVGLKAFAGAVTSYISYYVQLIKNKL